MVTCRRRRPERMELELGLDPDDAARLPRLALLAPLKSSRTRSRAVRIVWHDGLGGALAEQGLVIVEERPGWRLERLLPNAKRWPRQSESTEARLNTTTASMKR